MNGDPFSDPVFARYDPHFSVQRAQHLAACIIGRVKEIPQPSARNEQFRRNVEELQELGAAGNQGVVSIIDQDGDIKRRSQILDGLCIPSALLYLGLAQYHFTSIRFWHVQPGN